MATVTILRGKFRGQKIVNKTFTLLEGLHTTASGKNVITVVGTTLNDRPKAQIVVKSAADFSIQGEIPVVKTSPKARRERAAAKTLETVSQFEDESIPDVETNETDEEIIVRGRKRFDVLNKLTLGARRGDIRGAFVTGAPGIGKTYGVEKTLAEAGMIEQFENSPQHYEVVSGAMTSLGLYMKLFEFCEAGKVLVIDDCDDVFNDDTSLNLLKAALDTSAKRKLYWNVASHVLDKADVPNDFEFEGSIIFISNINFRKVRSNRLRSHLSALMSRSHFLDLTIHSFREKMLRIKDLIENSDMLEKFKLGKRAKADMLEFFYANAEHFNTLDLRTVIKLAGLVKTTGEVKEDWIEMAQMTLMGNPLHYEG